jgi:hypothetical protein
MNRGLLHKLTTVGNNDWLLGRSVLLSTFFEIFHNVQSGNDLSKDYMISV